MHAAGGPMFNLFLFAVLCLSWGSAWVAIMLLHCSFTVDPNVS